MIETNTSLINKLECCPLFNLTLTILYLFIEKRVILQNLFQIMQFITQHNIAYEIFQGTIEPKKNKISSILSLHHHSEDDR